MKPKDIEPLDSKSRWHGYHEWYKNNKISYRGHWKHGNEVGYEEFHITKETIFYIR